MPLPEDMDLILRIQAGDLSATRLYCGSYTLVTTIDGKRYRCKGDIPPEYIEVVDVYDKDGFLKMEYWSLPRIIDGKIR